MENEAPADPPPKIWNFPYVLSLFFLKASLTFQTPLKCLFGELYDHEVYWEITIDRKQD